MQRKDKEVTDQKAIEEIINKAQVCRLSVAYENMSYIVPMNFGYANQTLYFHSAREGLKLSILRENPQACFEMDIDTKIIPNELACRWTMRYQSVIGFGEVEFIDELDAKRAGMQIIMQHYTDEKAAIEDASLSGVTLFKLKINKMMGKKSGY